MSPVQRRDWLLVLSSRNIPWHIQKVYGIEHLYVPPILERQALYELAAFMRENIIRQKPHEYPAHSFAFLSILVFIPLIIWHGFRHGVWKPPAWLPEPQNWLQLGELDKIRLSLSHEYYRAVTSLTLHADASHLAGNVFFGAIFMVILARMIGAGRAVFLTILGGLAGNLLSSFLHYGAYRSIGFSTALFASVGIMGGVLISRAYDKRSLLVTAGGVIGLLAMLGTEGDHTDYAAHLCGMCCGFLCGLYEAWRQKKNFRSLNQWQAAFAALLIPFMAWLAAFGWLKI